MIWTMMERSSSIPEVDRFTRNKMIGFSLHTCMCWRQRKRSRHRRYPYGLEESTEKRKRRLPSCKQRLFPLLLFLLLLSVFEASSAYLTTPTIRIPSLCSSLQRTCFVWRKQSMSRLILWDTERSSSAAAAALVTTTTTSTNNLLNLTSSCSSSSSNETISWSTLPPPPSLCNGHSSKTTTTTAPETTANGATQPQTQTNVHHHHHPLDMWNSHSQVEKIDNGDENGDNDDDDDDDVPRLTLNGGYTHTKQARAKISAANKGKTPWNKGKKRSDEVKARIAEGVRRRNRQRFLQKLADMGMTEQEYQAQEREKKHKREAEKRARRTEKGGYRPTEATKQKISKILKERYATGEIKRRKVDPAKVRRGFTHTEETRRKIAESMRKKWAGDTTYRERMMQFSSQNNSPDIRQKISETLRKKWQDPEFRERMMKTIANRKSTTSGPHAQAHREKISAAMKAKWKDEDYRKKTLESIARRNAATAAANKKKLATTKRRKPTLVKKATSISTVWPRQPVQVVNSNASSSLSSSADTNSSSSSSSSSSNTARMPNPISVVSPKQQPNPKKQTTGNKTKTTPKRKPTATSLTTTTTAAKPKGPIKSRASAQSKLKGVESIVDNDDFEDSNKRINGLNASMATNGESSSSNNNNNEKDKKGKPGSVSQLREERRDLYDLLYGDDEDRASSSSFTSISALGDENLDNFDPYGLEDF